MGRETATSQTGPASHRLAVALESEGATAAEATAVARGVAKVWAPLATVSAPTVAAATAAVEMEAGREAGGSGYSYMHH